jgi:class 3 adenylate cyclase
MLDQANRTFICSVVFIDLVGYSKKTVTEQIRLKTSLTNNLSEAIKDIPVNDRIILDTGDGAAISFLGDPEDALVRNALAARSDGARGHDVHDRGGTAARIRCAWASTSAREAREGHQRASQHHGDGINVAQRIMSFARPGQIVVSRSYYDVVSNLASEYAKLFSYEGSRTDKHVREHEIYVVGHHEGALQKAKDGMKDRASSTQSIRGARARCRRSSEARPSRSRCPPSSRTRRRSRSSPACSRGSSSSSASSSPRSLPRTHRP